jgi:hypothetical protein
MKPRMSAGFVPLMAIGLFATRAIADPTFYAYGSKTVGDDGAVLQVCEFRLLNSPPSGQYSMEFTVDANGKTDSTATINYNQEGGWEKSFNHAMSLDGHTLGEGLSAFFPPNWNVVKFHAYLMQHESDFRDACAASLANTVPPSGLWASSFDLHTTFGSVIPVETGSEIEH